MQNKSILVIGTSSGIGRATALRLDRLGFQVFASVRNEEDAKKINQDGSGTLIPVIFDITDQSSLERGFQKIQSHVGEHGLQAIVHGASFFTPGPLELISIPDLRTIFEVNVFGHIAALHVFLPLLRQGKGQVIVISSVAGQISIPFAAAYSMTKFAMEAACNALRVEFATMSIPVSLIEPNAIRTPIWTKAETVSTRLEKTMSTEQMHRYGKPMQVLDKILVSGAKDGRDPEIVATVIEQCIRAKHPKPRYSIGMPLVAMSLFHVLPTRGVDWFFRKFFRL